MANQIDGNPLYLDTAGIISTIPLRIQKIILYPNATGNSAVLNYWLESDAVVTTYGTRNAKTVTVTASTSTFASTGNFETDNINAYQIMKVISTSSGKNLGHWEIATNADDNTITVFKPAATLGNFVTLADDTAGTYSWRVWDPRVLLTIRGSGVTDDTDMVQVDFPARGFWVPNLALGFLSASTVLHVYLNN